VTTPLDPDATLDPRSVRRAPAQVPVLHHVYDGGAQEPGARRWVLKEGEVRVGRTVDGERDIRLERDPRVSRHHATLHVGRRGRVELENVSKHGTTVGSQVADRRALEDGDVLTVGESVLVFRLEPMHVPAAPDGDPLVGRSAALADVRANVALVGPTRATVLLLGESGVGKEVVARAVHARSGRQGPFIPVNCGAIPETLAESQLFGHKKGAFTGAQADHVGLFAQADGGTLFLDELGELPAALQPKLLRVLDDKRVWPVGATEPIEVDVRLVCATNRDLEAAVADDRFRGDLFARVAEIPINLPPLRERPEDVIDLVEHALEAGAPPLAPELASALVLYAWPYNVRELFKIATELSVRGAGAERLELELVESRLRAPAPKATAPSAPAVQGGAVPQAGQLPERDEVVALLERHKGVIADIARETGRSRKQIYRWLGRYDLDAATFREEDA
jgi:transcriptional regulator with GAF, ATPase, and Fis domain